MRIRYWSSDVCSSDLVKDYGYMFRTDPGWAARAARVSAIARDVAEFLGEIGLDVPTSKHGLTVAYHAACSLQHGQQVRQEPKLLLAAAGFVLREEIGRAHV